jgi:hypothetical protein
MCLLWWKSSCQLQRTYSLQGLSKENIPISLFEDIHFCKNKKKKTHALTQEYHAQITKQEFHAPTNTEQEPHIKQSHQQTSCMQELKNMMKKSI